MKRLFSYSGVLIVVVFSSLLCVLFCILWVRSYWRWDGIAYSRDITSRSLGSVNGRIGYNSRTGFECGPGSWSFDSVPSRWWTPMVPPTTWHARIGFGYSLSPMTGPRGKIIAWDRSFEVPTWFLALLAGIAPATWLVRHLRQRRRGQEGFCPGCGYDLRATPQRCPECGREISGRGIMTIDGRCP